MRTGLGHGASPVSYRHNFLVFIYLNLSSFFIFHLFIYLFLCYFLVVFFFFVFFF